MYEDVCVHKQSLRCSRGSKIVQIEERKLGGKLTANREWLPIKWSYGQALGIFGCETQGFITFLSLYSSFYLK